ncbi:MAG: BatD family protein [Polyangiales bacterium]
MAIPTKTGELELSPAKVEFDFPGDGFFSSSTRLARQSEPIEIDVKPLPQSVPQPVAVGHYELKWSADRTTVATGDAITVHATLVGDGNPLGIQLTPQTSDGLRVLEPRVQETFTSVGSTVNLTREIEWIVVAEKPGTHTIAPLVINTFDPTQGNLHRLETEPISVEVVATGTSSIVSTPANTIPTNPLQASRDATNALGALRLQSALERSRRPWASSIWFWVALFAPAIVFLITLASKRVRARHHRANARSLKHAIDPSLRRAQQAASKSDAHTFYSEISQALLTALSRALDANATGMTHQEISARMQTAGFDRDLIERVQQELDGADFARFGAEGGSEDEMRRCMDRFETLISRLERGHAT